MKFLSWNVASYRALLRKIDFTQYIKKHDPDIIFIGESKLCIKETVEEIENIYPYNYWNYSTIKKGYSGTIFYSKIKPLSIIYGMNIDKHDKEGRLITLEFQKYYIIGGYIPNSGAKLVRLDYRTNEWDIDFIKYVTKLQKKKPVIITGDLNVAHTKIDIHNHKNNYNKSAGYTQHEIDNFQYLLDLDLIDSFRYLYPNTIQYTYWNYRFKSREKNKGWRIDFFLIPKSFKKKLKDVIVHHKQLGSDHAPIIMEIDL